MTLQLIVTTVVFATCASAQRAVSDISPVFARYGIHAITGATTEGDAALAAKLGPDIIGSLAGLRSHIAMIRNECPHTIVEVIWIWTGITPDGRRVPMVVHTRGGVVEGIKTGDSLVTGPSFPLAKILMQRARQPRTDLSGLAGAVAEERNNLARYIAVEASLDSVVLGNGTVLGPDHWDLIESRRAVNAAEAEISAKLNDSSISDADLNAWLEEVSKRPLTLKPNGLSDHSTVIGGIARAMKHLVQQNGRAKVAGTLFDVTARNAAAKQLISVKE